MTEKDKMLTGKLYDSSAKDLFGLQIKAHDICRKYNLFSETDPNQQILLEELISNAKNSVYLQWLIQFDYGCFTKIGDKCWLVGNVTICGGVKIGSGCVIGARSVVSRDIPENSVAVGVPCKVLRQITEQDSLKFEWFE